MALVCTGLPRRNTGILPCSAEGGMPRTHSLEARMTDNTGSVSYLPARLFRVAPDHRSVQDSPAARRYEFAVPQLRDQ
jgi:hypothetical protein